MTLSPDAEQLLAEELRILDEVLTSLRHQQNYLYERSKIENARSRELTAQLVATKREEDRAMLASDEAVSRVLDLRNQAEEKSLIKLLKKPYFARIVLDEELPDGKRREIGYKIGPAANTDCRIIDWRRAPISKLYYEYKEGDEYCEQIQGVERLGRVQLRNLLEIENGQLRSVTCRYGHFTRVDNTWRSSAGGRPASSLGQLPDILSLITAEQFQSITEDCRTAILIQGVAGSGKTSVALHRLAWLTHEGNSPWEAEDCLVLVLTKSLRDYIKNSLAALDMAAVPVFTFGEWSAKLLASIVPQFVVDGSVRRPMDPTPSSVARLKGSIALLSACEEFARRPDMRELSPEQIIMAALSDTAHILKHDQSRLIDRDLITSARTRSISNFERGTIEPADDPLILRIAQLRGYSLRNGRIDASRYAHVVIDEVQDFNPAQLGCVVGSVEDTSHLTFVGDTEQRLEGSAEFPGWEKLRSLWKFDQQTSRYISLSVSHRSTLPIMKLADHVRRAVVPTKTGRNGRAPIWFKGPTEQLAIPSMIQWLTTAMERYPTMLTAVLCRDKAEAKFALTLLQPTFGASARLADGESFSFEAGIVVADIREVKGLEFMNVLIWNPSSANYPAGDEIARNLLYVAVSRAQENCCIVSWSRPSPLLPSFNSPLVRAVPIEPPEEDAPHDGGLRVTADGRPPSHRSDYER